MKDEMNTMMPPRSNDVGQAVPINNMPTAIPTPMTGGAPSSYYDKSHHLSYQEKKAQILDARGGEPPRSM